MTPTMIPEVVTNLSSDLLLYPRPDHQLVYTENILLLNSNNPSRLMIVQKVQIQQNRTIYNFSITTFLSSMFSHSKRLCNISVAQLVYT